MEPLTSSAEIRPEAGSSMELASALRRIDQSDRDAPQRPAAPVDHPSKSQEPLGSHAHHEPLHGPGHEHRGRAGHRHHGLTAIAAPRLTLLDLSALQRLLGVASLLGLLWAAVLWALR